MPGGRLTQQECRQIALGPADSLPYAEIARRLDRPTSTITREVVRNGGPTAYRADLAHLATERRTPPAQARLLPRAGVSPQSYGRDAEAVTEYEDDCTAGRRPRSAASPRCTSLSCRYCWCCHRYCCSPCWPA